jgi:hypothetical protein
MIYLIGGAPRVGKSILCQQVAARLRAGWISTDLLLDLLRSAKADGVKTEWNASTEAIRGNAEWFFPYLERFVWGANSLAKRYVIEGVDFLSEQVDQLSKQYPIRSVFLGLSELTLEVLDQYPGRSPGYSYLPEEMRRRIVRDVPVWSELVREEAGRFGYPYIDMAGKFAQRLLEAEDMLLGTS